MGDNMLYDLHPIFKPESGSYSGVIRDIQSVMIDRDGVPTITIINYRGFLTTYSLPEPYFDWVRNCEDLIRYNVQLFPRSISIALVGEEPYIQWLD